MGFSDREIYVSQPVHGFRRWTVKDGVLIGARGGKWNPRWRDRPYRAGCEHPHSIFSRHVTPVLDCTCGYYACWSSLNMYSDILHVAGIVAAKGKLIEGSTGFRAYRCRIIALALDTHSSFYYAGSVSLETLSSLYKVPVYHSVAYMLKEHSLTPRFKVRL